MLKEIWSQRFWDGEAERIEMIYWDLIKNKFPNVPASHVERPTEHRIEAFVRFLSRKHGIGNLHVGLTSSDIEDNVRIKRIEKSLEFVESKLNVLWQKIDERMTKDTNIQAYTHLLPAGYIRLQDRFNPLIEAYYSIKMPTIVYKGIGGSLGVGHVQKHLGIDLTDMQQYLNWTNVQTHKSQTGNHMTELNVAQWLQSNSALLQKFCNDLRQMFAFDQAVNKSGDIASSAIVSKKTPNPWRAEKATSLLEELIDIPARVARILANCLLERTLTNQSALNRLFERGFQDFAECLDLIDYAIDETIIIESPKDIIPNAEIQMVDYIIKHKCGREEVYMALNKNIK